MRRDEIVSLQWERVDLDTRILRVEETRTGEPLDLTIARQPAAILGRLRAEAGYPAEEPEGWVFPSLPSKPGHIVYLSHLYPRIGRPAGTGFRFHGPRNCFIAMAEREPILPRSLTTRLVNHARPSDVTERYAADWTVEQLRDPAQRVAGRIDESIDPDRSPVAAWLSVQSAGSPATGGGRRWPRP